MATAMKGVVVSCAAPDDDPLEQGLGVCVQFADGPAAGAAEGEGGEEKHDANGSSRGAFFMGEMGEGQMHGLGRVETEEETYVGFWERGLHHGQGLLLDHEEKSRSEGRFSGGVLVDGSSTSITVDREGKRGAEGGLEGRGVKVLRGAPPPQQQQQQQEELGQGQQQQWKKVLKGTFQGDLLHGQGSVWLCHARKATTPSPSCAVAAPPAPAAAPAAAAPAAAAPATTSLSAGSSVEESVSSRLSGAPHHSISSSSVSCPSSFSSPFQDAQHHQEGTDDDSEQQQQHQHQQHQQHQQQHFDLDLRLEAAFEEGIPCFGRAFFSDGRVYIGGLERRERRRGIGFTVTKAGKAVIAFRDGDNQVGYGLVLDFASHTYRRTPAGSAQVGEEVTVDAVAAAASASAVPTDISLPSFWNQEGVLGLLEGAMADPVAVWGTLEAFSKALREEQACLLNETPPRVAVGLYVRKLTEEETAAAPVLATLYQGEKDKEGRREGQGVGLLLPSGDIFKGTWVKDAPEGKGTWVSLVNKDVFEGEVERSGVGWKTGRWSSLWGWRVEATKWLHPRMPHGFVTVRAPVPSVRGEHQWQEVQHQRAVVEAFYRMRGTGGAVTVKRDDMDVRITSGPEGSRRTFRGRVYPSLAGTAASILLEVPRPRNGLEYREDEHGSMYELVYDEDGVMIGNRIAVLRHVDGSTEFGGEFMEIMSNAPMDYHKNHVKQQSVRAEKEWPGKLLDSFETHYTGAVGGDESVPGGGAFLKQQQQQHTHAVGPTTTGMTMVATTTAPDRYLHHPSPSSPRAVPIPAPAAPAPVSIPESLKKKKQKHEQQEQQHEEKDQDEELKEHKKQALSTLRVAGPVPKTRLASFLPDLVRATAKANERITAAQQKATSRALVKEQRLQQQQQQLSSKQVGNADERRRRKSSTSASPKVGMQSFKALQESDDDEEEEGMIKEDDKEVDDREDQGGDLMDHPRVCSRVDDFPPLVIPEMRSDDTFSHQQYDAFRLSSGAEDSLRPSSTTSSSFSPLVTSPLGRASWASLSDPEAEFQVVAGKNKGKGASRNGKQQHQQQTRTPWTSVAGPLSIKEPLSHKKSALNSGGNPPPGMPPMEVLCIVEAGWQAAHVRILFRAKIPEVKVLGYRVVVHRTERALPGAKDYKAVESTRSEFPVLGLMNHVKYNFAPSVRVQFRQYTWRVQGDTVRTSPPGPVKHKPTSVQQPFLRRLNEKGELMPNDDNGYWQWARYVSGHELSPDLAPMKAFALKAHVMQGDKMLSLEMDLAKELLGHAKSLMVWVHPAAEPGLVSSGKHVCKPFVEGEAFCAVVSGLLNEKKYHVAFRVTFFDGSYPPGDGIIILPGRPIAEAAGGVGKQLSPRTRSSSTASSSPSLIPSGDVQQKQQRREEWPTLTDIGSASPGEGTVAASVASAASAAVCAAEEADAPATTSARRETKILRKPSSISPLPSLELPYRAAVTMPKLMSPPPGLASSKEGQREFGVVLTPLPHLRLASPLLGAEEPHGEREKGREDDKHLPLVSCNREAMLLGRENGAHYLAPTSQPRQARGIGGREEGRENVKEDDGDAGLLVDVDDIFRMVNMEALTLIHGDDEGEEKGGDDKAEGLGGGELLKRLKERKPHAAQKEQTAEEKEHVFLFKRQAGSDPEFRGTLTGAVVGRQPGQQQQFFGLPPIACTPFSAGNLIGATFQPGLSISGRGGDTGGGEAGEKGKQGGGGKGLALEPFWSLPSTFLLSQKEGGPLLGMGGNCLAKDSSTSSASISAGSSLEQCKVIDARGLGAGGTASTTTHPSTKRTEDLGDPPLSPPTVHSFLQEDFPDRFSPLQQQHSQQQEQQRQEASSPGKTKTDLTASAPAFCLVTQRSSSSSSSFSASPPRVHPSPTLGPTPLHSQAARHLPPHYTPAQAMMYAQQTRYGSPPPPPSLAAQSSSGHSGGNISYHGLSGIVSRPPPPPALAHGNSIICMAAYPPPPAHAQPHPPPGSVHYHHITHTGVAAAATGPYHHAAASHHHQHLTQAQAPMHAANGGYGHSRGQHGPGAAPPRFQDPLHSQPHSHHHHHPHYPPHYGYH